MSKAFIDDTNLTNIANSIRSKLGVSDTYLPSEMAGAIQNIPKRKVIDFNITPKTLDNAEQNSLQYVKAYGGTEQRNLPLGYQELEYIESTGTQYIDTGIIISSEVVNVKAKALLTSLSNGKTLCGSQINTSSGFGGLIYYEINTFGGLGGCFGTNYNNNTYQDISIDTIYNIEYSANNGTGLVSINGVSNQITYSGTLISNKNWYIFWSNGGRDTYFISAKIYGIQLKDNNILKFNGIPCKNSSGVIGMYDTVSHQFLTNAGTGDFIAGPHITTYPIPTPTSPVDIVCNNGVLKARHESGLPLGYTLLDYIEATGTQYIDTGVKANQNTKIELQGIQGSGDCALFGISAYLYAFNVNNATSCYYGLCNYTNSATVSFRGNPHTIVMSKADGFVLDGTVIGSLTDADNTESTYNVALFGRTSNDNGTVNKLGNHRIYYCKLYNSGTLVRNFVPAKRNSDNVIGMYDTVSRQFFTNTGSGTFVAGNTVSDPTIIYTEGNTETIKIGSENLVDFTSLTIISNTAISETGELVSNRGVNFCESYISVLPNQTYKINGDILGGNIGYQTYYFRLASYDVDKIFISRSDDAVTGTEYTFTTDSTTKYIRFHYINTATLNTYKLQLDNTATCERLLELNGYTDTQEILSGIVNRKIGIKVLDGSESWTALPTPSERGYYINIPAIANVPYDTTLKLLCTQFKYQYWENQGTTIMGDNCFSPNMQNSKCNGNITFHPNMTTFNTVTSWTTYLTSQYNAGTPVIIVYPLTTEITETVTAQPMTSAAGDNTLEITQSSLPNLEVECEYFIQ